MDERVVEGGEDVRHSEHELTVPHLGQGVQGTDKSLGARQGLITRINYTSSLGPLAFAN